jgi:hypothetical protein
MASLRIVQDVALHSKRQPGSTYFGDATGSGLEDSLT